MACAHPLRLNPRIFYGTRSYSYGDIEIPCRYCVNCRRDKQNELVDRATYEYCKRLSASFLTVTYDDVWLVDRCAVTDNFGLIFDEDNGKKVIRTSLNFRDVRNFIHALRQRVKEHYDKMREKDPNYFNVLMQPDFSYMYVGEYGDMYGRCHFHILFFGLDFALCKKMFRETWRFGICDVLPLLDGGIRYVTKYMDKMDKGYLAWRNFDCRGITRPKLCCSRGFGESLLWDNVKDIYENNFSYLIPGGKGKRRPISSYWRFLITGGYTRRDYTKKNYFKQADWYIAYKKNLVAEKMKSYELHRQGIDILDDKEQDKFRHRQALIREASLKRQLRNDGRPVYDDISEVMFSKFGFISYDGRKIRRLPSLAQRLLAEQYIHSLQERWLYDKFPPAV